MLLLIVFLTIALPVAWIASEFQERRWLRILAGCAALSMSFLVASGVGMLERLNSNAWYGSASKELIDTTIAELERGNTDQLVAELKTLQASFDPTYENRAQYDKLVAEFRRRLGEE